jgi:hypothetical protein
VKEYKIVTAGGIFTILFAAFILIMRLKFPSDGGNPAVFYLVLFLLFAAGILCCLRGSLHGLTVEDMHMLYRSSFGRIKEFTLDDIGYCSLELSQSKDNLILYDLLGKKLCKLKINMKGCEEFLQYLLDNGVRIEWETTRTNLPALELILRETAVCEEEIPKCTEALYTQVREILSQWEKEHAVFGAVWELGFGEYAAADLEDVKDMRSVKSSIDSDSGGLPRDYICALEAYLKKDGEFVIDRNNRTVCITAKYLIRCRSYQIGEDVRIRKTDEEMIADWIKERLLFLTQALPRHKYHTEGCTIQHTLKNTAGKKEETYGTGSTMYGTDKDLRQKDCHKPDQSES